MLVGVGAGQMSRVDSVHLAVRKAGERSRGSVLASDAFFPFRDNIDEAARAGVTAVVQPGGSMRDADSVAACDEHGLAMVLTDVRHFRHLVVIFGLTRPRATRKSQLRDPESLRNQPAPCRRP